MFFSEAFGLVSKDTIAIIGSGGKTSLCYQIARENIHKKVALTTTTKIFPATKEDVGKKSYNFYGKDLPHRLHEGVSLFGKFFDSKKISSLKTCELDRLICLSELFIYEADGSKCKPLKAWKNSEPVILKNSTKVIGVIPLFVLGKMANESFIHNYELFKEIFGIKYGEKIKIELLVKIVKEMFAKVPNKMEKILYINYAKSEDDFLIAKEMALQLKNIKVFAGSLKEQTIREIQ